MKRSIISAMALTATAVALGITSLAWPTGTASQDNDQMVNCPQPSRWSIAVWDGPSGTDAETALATCATDVIAAYHLDPDTQGWLRWFAGRPEISNLQSLDELQGVLVLGEATTTAAAGEVETVTAAQADQMVNCPQAGKWSIAVWDGPSDTDSETALATCAETAVIAAYHLDPDTQGWLRWFAGRPEISNLQSLDGLQGVLVLGGAVGEREISFSVDESVTPAASELPGFEDGVPRPLASIVDELGNQADFVADELILLTDDPAALDDFLARWEGEILLTFDPVDYAGITATIMNPMYLVRINTALADAAALEADLRAITEEGQGDHRVSSQEALDLLAAAASEAVGGLDIGVNWVATGGDFRSRVTTEAPTGPGGYSSNTYNWSHLNAGSTQDIGVTEAWRALDIMGRLDNTVRFAVLDMGFEPDDDFPTPWTAISNVPFVDPIGTENFASCSGGHPCPWHGTNVVGAGMGVPDNDWGGAGVAGPIAEPILVFTLYDFATGIVAVAQAAVEGADIINMSYSARVPTIVAWTVYPFELATWAVRESGVLLFAAAGNDGDNVDAEDCLWPFDWPCWERAWHTPCENDGVICVGALAWDSQDRASYSNHGPEHVDIFAPGTNWVGPDPDNAGNIAQSVSGTSAASPYAAGVAALIWAADPSLSADEVEDILYATAHTSPDADVDLYVNAYDGVTMALGSAPPQVSITSPADGSAHSRGAESIAFIAEAIDVEDDTLTVTWTSSLDGEIGTGTHVYRNDLSFGTHTITATATDSDGLTGSDTITITIVNDPPIVEITNPDDGDSFYQAQTIILRGLSRDPNTVPAPYEPLPDAQVEWLIDDTPFDTGHEAPIPGGTLSLGTHTISFTGSDGELEDTDTITITILENPADLPPDHVEITSPAHGSSWPAEAFDSAEGMWYKEVTLEGEAHDPEDGDLTGLSLVWTTSINEGPIQELGTGESVTVRLYAPVATSTHVITLTATDSADNSATDRITVTVILLI